MTLNSLQPRVLSNHGAQSKWFHTRVNAVPDTRGLGNPTLIKGQHFQWETVAWNSQPGNFPLHLAPSPWKVQSYWERHLQKIHTGQAQSSALQTQPQTWPHRKYIQTKGQTLLPVFSFTHEGKGQFTCRVSFLGNELSLQTPKTWMEEFPWSWGTTTGDHLCRHEWSHGGNNHHHFTLRVSWPISPTWVWTPKTPRKGLAFL